MDLVDNPKDRLSRDVEKFLIFRHQNLFYNCSKLQTNWPYCKGTPTKADKTKASSADPDQSNLSLHFSLRPICSKT